MSIELVFYMVHAEHCLAPRVARPTMNVSNNDRLALWTFTTVQHVNRGASEAYECGVMTVMFRKGTQLTVTNALKAGQQ